jgi:protein-L-isoaspartate O-methyltransferase
MQSFEGTSAVDKKRSEIFDEVAQLYDAVRPDYPEALIEDIIELADLPTSATILEVGTGTGKATIPFASRGYSIHCLEPGRNLAAVASKNLHSYPNVVIETVKFEDWQLQESVFDLVISAQAFHWIPASIGYPKAAQALKEKGHIAVFWNFSPNPDNEIFQELLQAYQTYAPSMSWRKASIEALMQKRENWLLQSGRFKNLAIKQYPWSIRYTAEQYLDILNTQTDYRTLPEASQQELSQAIRGILNARGGFIVKPYLSALFFAQKA